MTKVQANSQGKIYVANNKALLATSLGTKSITTNGTYAASSDNLDGYSSVTVSVGGPAKKYKLFDKIKDDSNNEIGIVSGFHTDNNNIEYAVVCLYAQYRLDGGAYMNSGGIVTNLTQIQDQTLYTSTDTATSNTQKILDYCASSNKTSTSCSHCRSKSFVIDDVTYYGQLPTAMEVVDILRNRATINSADNSGVAYVSLLVPTSKSIWTSNQYDSQSSWYVRYAGSLYVENKYTSSGFLIMPVLELPNTTV